MIYTKEQQAKNRKKWVAALRSGDYKQTSEYLRDKDGYCCLGVACDISGLGEWEDTDPFNVYKIDGYMGTSAYLPAEMVDYLGLTCELGSLNINNTFYSLSAINDSGEYDFDDISDIIENNKSLIGEK